ncbi:MAG: protein disulfide oxidoreductase [bacterium JZ-2024 1]
MLHAHQKKQVEDMLKKSLVGEVEVLLFTQKLNCPYCEATTLLMREVAELSPKIHLKEWNFLADQNVVSEYRIERVPAIVIKGKKEYGIRFYGIPAGYEFSVFLEALIQVSQRENEKSPVYTKKFAFPAPVNLKVFVTPTCPYCPHMSTLAIRWSLESEQVSAEIIEASEFPELAERYEVFGVPRTVVNDRFAVEGAVPEEDFYHRVLEYLNSQTS